MKGRTGTMQRFFNHFQPQLKWLFLVFMLMLALSALIEFLYLGLARRTFIFYAINDGLVTVEERMLPVSGGSIFASCNIPLVSIENDQGVPSREVDLTRYVEETLYGPTSPDAMPLFPRDTRLRSLLYQDDVVYVDFTEEAAMPPLESIHIESGGVLENIKTLSSGIRRNFPFVRDICFFISGNAVYTGTVF